MKRKISFYAKVMVTERTVNVSIIRTIAFLFLVRVQLSFFRSTLNVTVSFQRVVDAFLLLKGTKAAKTLLILVIFIDMDFISQLDEVHML